MTLSRHPYTFDRVVRLVISAIIVIIALWFIYVLRGVLLPFGVACLIAYIFEPFVQYNRSLLKLKGRTSAVFITLFEAVFLACVLGYFFVPSVIEELHQVGALVMKYADSEQEIPFLPDSVHEFLKKNIDFAAISSFLSKQDMTVILHQAIRIVSSGIDMLLSLFSWMLVFLYVAFIMLDYDRLRRGFRRMVPPRYREQFYAVGRDIKESMNHYFRGQALVAFCVGVLFSIGFLIVGLPLAVVLGMFIGLLNMVPYLQLISIPVSVLLCLVYSTDSGVDFWPIFWATMAVYVVVQIIQDLFLTPKIMGREMGLNPAIILLSLSVWGTLLGLLGMIIALPLTTLCLSYYERYVLHGDDDREAVRKMTEISDE